LPALAASSTVKVTLWDRGAHSMQMPGQEHMMGMPGMKGMHGMGRHGPMGLELSVRSVPKGTVSFQVRNGSKIMVHEMVVSPVKDGTKQLPYDAAKMQVDEDAAGHLGEVAELEPGKSGALTLDLKPGVYILYCNVPGHYTRGMWTLLTVKG
jgi:uncharacterized cupredoxin-like copper-binding protein